MNTFPFYGSLSEEGKKLLSASVCERTFMRGEEVSRGECTGLLLVRSGRLRAYTMSAEGREITLYRLGKGDVCLFSASCALYGMQADIFVRAEEETRVLLLPAEVYRALSEKELAAAAFTGEMTARRLSEVLWVLDEVLNKKFDARLAALLLEEAAYAGSDSIHTTHEKLAAHLGTVREAVSRMLRYFEEEGLVSLSRGGIRIEDRAELERLSAERK